MTAAEDRGWGKGWPSCQTEKWEPLEVFSLDGRLIRFPAHKIRSENGRLVFEEEVGFPGGVREEIFELVSILLHESEVRGYINLQPGWCWGGACRPIKRPDGTLSTTPSNHSWGLALDINAPENPFGAANPTIGRPMADLWGEFGFGWGGDFSNRDYMHFEYVGRPVDAARHTAKARRALGGDELTPEQEKTLKETKAFLDALRDGLKPGKDTATPGGAGTRVAKAVRTVERAQEPE